MFSAEETVKIVFSKDSTKKKSEFKKNATAFLLV